MPSLVNTVSKTPVNLLSRWRCQIGRCGLGQLQMDHYGRVDATSSSLYKAYRYPVEIISHCVWLYHRFPLSFREVEEMMMERGVIVSYETMVPTTPTPCAQPAISLPWRIWVSTIKHGWKSKSSSRGDKPAIGHSPLVRDFPVAPGDRH